MTQKIKALLPIRIKKAAKRNLYSFIGFIVKILEAVTGQYLTFHLRPRASVLVTAPAGRFAKTYENFSIVMQGPIMIEHNFTVETLRLYRKFYPDALLVLSTWEGEDAQHLELARKAGAKIILNRKPPVFGPSNVNLQLTSAKVGINLSAARGQTYTLKTRTDQRIYNSQALALLANLLQGFPLKDQAIQKGRIISLGAYNLRTKNKLFHVFDHLIFGFTDDVRLYFAADLVSERPVLEFLKQRYPQDPFTAESYFYSEFLKKVGFPLEYSEASYFLSLSRHALLVDPVLLDWYWRSKHRRYLEYYSTHRGYQSPRHHGFGDWLDLYRTDQT